jgi:xanthine dehydrogenase accessory factor
MRELLAEVTAALSQGRDCVYCSVVDTRGSTPQKAGAAMLVFPDGSQRGTLGGGCVEAEVKQRALQVLAKGGRPEVLTFCLDDDYGWDDGLICGGRMSTLIDPLAGPLAQGDNSDPQQSPASPAARSYYQRFQELADRGAGCTEAVVIKEGVGPALGSRYLFDADGNLAAWLGDVPAPDEMVCRLIPLSQRPRPFTNQGIAYLPILPRITLLIVGAGHVGQAVARLAAEVDFEVWVVDDRERYASRERFPSARQRFLGDIGLTVKELAQGAISPSTFCLIVTRGHAHDEEALYHLAPTCAGYVGMIGSRRKIKLIYEDLIAKGVSPEALAKVHAPLGFEIGARTVPEIAISIVAELIAHRNLGTSELPKRVPVQAGNLSA